MILKSKKHLKVYHGTTNHIKKKIKEEGLLKQYTCIPGTRTYQLLKGYKSGQDCQNKVFTTTKKIKAARYAYYKENNKYFLFIQKVFKYFNKEKYIPFLYLLLNRGIITFGIPEHFLKYKVDNPELLELTDINYNPRLKELSEIDFKKLESRILFFKDDYVFNRDIPKEFIK